MWKDAIQEGLYHMLLLSSTKTPQVANIWLINEVAVAVIIIIIIFIIIINTVYEHQSAHLNKAAHGESGLCLGKFILPKCLTPSAHTSCPDIPTELFAHWEWLFSSRSTNLPWGCHLEITTLTTATTKKYVIFTVVKPFLAGATPGCCLRMPIDGASCLSPLSPGQGSLLPVYDQYCQNDSRRHERVPRRPPGLGRNEEGYGVWNRHC